MRIKEDIRNFVLDLGIDDVGFAAAVDYKSPRTTPIEEILPGVKSIIVLAIREMSHVESPSAEIAMNGRLDSMEFLHHCNFKLARYIEMKLQAKAISIPFSYPLKMDPKNKEGIVAEVSLRHAAIAAGLGNFGRHNLVIHPRLGARVIFTAILTDLELESDPPVTEDLCIHCNICEKTCPANALEKENFTDVNRCLRKSQPYGLGKTIGFWNEFVDKTPEEQKRMFMTKDYWQMYQTQFIGFQYFCFNCYKNCPIGMKMD